MQSARPAVGLLYNSVTADVIAHAGDLVEYVAVMPGRLWYDFGPQAHSRADGRRFHRAFDVIDDFRRCAEDRLVAGHGLGLSLPSAMPLDEALLDAVAAMSRALGFRWFSEHLSVFITPKGSLPDAQAGLGLPVTYDEETFAIVAGKLARLRAALDCPVLMENGSFFTPIPDMDMSEPEFMNRLYREGHCETLLDLHNLYVTWRNGGDSLDDYLAAIDPDAVTEIHLGGGDEFQGFYLDSHSGLTPPEVWRHAFAHASRFRRLRAITFEFQESYYDRLGPAALAGELARMHELAAACAHAREPAHAG